MGHLVGPGEQVEVAIGDLEQRLDEAEADLARILSR